MMYMPSIFGDNYFDVDTMMDWPFSLDFFDNKRNPLYGKHQKNLMKTDIKEQPDKYCLDVDLPGFKKDELHLELKNGYMTISASKSLDKDEKQQDGTYLRRERYSGSMARSFYVGEGVKQEDIKAKFEDGILKIEVPKKEAAKTVPENNYIAIEG